jgi:hypothetical protein
MQQSEPQWFKSSYSAGQGTECVEVALIRDGVAVRDSKDYRMPHLQFGTDAWATYVVSVREGGWRRTIGSD